MDAPSTEVGAPSWRIARACVVGTAHSAQGRECQDRFVAQQLRSACGEMIVVAAVADGASSASQSGTGAETAVDSFLDCVVATLRDMRVAQLPEDAPRAWLQTVRDNVLEQAAKAARPAHDYASTFLGVVAGEEACFFLQLGDGMIAVRSGESADWEMGCTPQRGEHVNETYFLTSSDALERTEIRRLSGIISDIAMTTDGLQSACFDRNAGLPFRDFFDHLMTTLLATPAEQEDQLDAGLARFLESDSLDAYTGDDKTLVLAARLRG